ncbi:MAG TPA: adenylyltransferase/cytidyltransferase family protein [Spirochaetia bacterium]|nr:adenylyltransferase/cytidyltransferase family protein [Spirochaetia bacterium]
MTAAAVLVTGGFDDLGLRHVRFLHECSHLGEVTVLLWSDSALSAATGALPKFSLAERCYLIQSLRFVSRVLVVESYRGPWRELKDLPDRVVVCADSESSGPEPEAAWRAAAALGVPVRGFASRDLRGFPEFPPVVPDPARRRVVVTGCYDWLHSGHVRFFEEVSGYGELYVIVGHDANVRLLKGDGHPRFPQAQRRYMTGSIRHVHRSVISTGSGWMDAGPEISSIGAHIYAVNEDGDKPEKREYCREHGLEYLVLRRLPADGLPKRTSTDLRGF